MKLLTGNIDGEFLFGVLDGNQVHNLTAGGFPRTMREVLASGEGGLAEVQMFIDMNIDKTVDVSEIEFLPPVRRPGKVLAVGRNYAAHAAEGGTVPPDYPMFFHKAATSLIGHGGTIVIPPVTAEADYEGELAVIIGRSCKNVSEAEALDYVAGYTVANDVSARDWQRRTSQFTVGKMVDTFGPLGPVLVTKDEIDDVHNLNIRTFLNGREMQNSNTSFMIFSVPFMISYVSQIVTLEPGDVILTGTPEGVGFARTPPVFLQDGDEIVVEIEQIGRLKNFVAKGE
ncbi:MAG: fumarylacetoacetate hydrolase family protein [Ardenticatenaceae bacterium]|nr:fumarylacetoacetate hydrolase family protein [Ardenticatenaceae bacterium]